MSWQQQPPGAQGASGGQYGHGQGTTPAGWYPDSSDPSVQRYWDGTHWTEHTAPLPTSADPAPGHGQHAAPPEGYSQAASGGAGPAPAQPGQQPYAQPGYGEPGGPYAAAGAPPGGGQRRNVGMLVGIGGGAAILVVLLVIIGINLFGDGGGADPAPTTPVETEEGDDEGTEEGEEGGSDDGPELGSDDPIEGSDDEPVETDTFSPGDLISGAVPEGGSWTGTMTVTEESAVILDARREASGSALDPTLTILDESGTEVTYIDDRPSELDFLTESRLNPYVALTLEPGEYTVEVGSFLSASEGDFVLETAALAMIEAEEYDEFTLEQGQYGGYSLNITEPGTYTLSVSVSSGNASVVLFDDNRVSEWNRGSSSLTEITVDLEPGIYPVLVAEGGASATTITFAVEAD